MAAKAAAASLASDEPSSGIIFAMRASAVLRSSFRGGVRAAMRNCIGAGGRGKINFAFTSSQSVDSGERPDVQPSLCPRGYDCHLNVDPLQARRVRRAGQHAVLVKPACEKSNDVRVP